MLPTVVANELRDAVGRFLRNAFPFATLFFQRSAGSTDNPTALIDELLHRHLVFHQLVQDADGITHLDELAGNWRERLNLASLAQARLLLTSLTSLVAAARLWDRSDDPYPKRCKPFLQLRLQLWLRELRRMVCSVPGGGDPPVLRFADDLKDTRNPLHLPLLHWRECHLGAWESLVVLGYRAATLISVMTGRLFATPYNQDFKLIAFSDSVQDAAHRAGFLGANTWRQVMRQAMAGWLQHQPLGLSLREMADLLPSYWRERMPDDARFCGLFIAPNMEWNPDYGHLTQHNRLPPGSDLPQLVSKRLAWECLSEFGRRSRVGRSLERTGAAAVRPGVPGGLHPGGQLVSVGGGPR